MITEERLRGLWRQYHPKPIILSEWELALYRAVEAEARKDAEAERDALQDEVRDLDVELTRARAERDKARGDVARWQADALQMQHLLHVVYNSWTDDDDPRECKDLCRTVEFMLEKDNEPL